MEQSNHKRLNYLDSLRGIAAVVVVLSHFALMSPAGVEEPVKNFAVAIHSLPNMGMYILSKIQMAARSVVILFYVLSGFVLARSLLKKETPYGGYVIKRFFRIYPALFFTILLSFSLHEIIGYNHEVMSSWLQVASNPDLSMKSLLKNLVLWGTEGSNSFDGVIWSLVHEMRISLFFPFILISVVRFRLAAVFIWLLISMVCTFFVYSITGMFIDGSAFTNRFGGWDFAMTWCDTVYFIIFFVLGAYLSLHIQPVKDFYARIPLGLRILLVAAILYAFLKTPHQGIYFIIGDYVKSIGAVGLIALAISSRKVAGILDFKIPVWLGRISYSLYLIHMPIIYVVTQVFGSSLSLFEICAIVLTLSFIAADLMARVIEYPINNFGKVISGQYVRRRYLTDAI